MTYSIGDNNKKLDTILRNVKMDTEGGEYLDEINIKSVKPLLYKGIIIGIIDGYTKDKSAFLINRFEIFKQFRNKGHARNIINSLKQSHTVLLILNVEGYQEQIFWRKFVLDEHIYKDLPSSLSIIMKTLK